jgi:hypothetical protein
VHIVRRRKQNALPFEPLEVAGVVVDEVVGQEDALVAAEHDVLPGNERKVLGQPVKLIGKAGAELHGRRGDIHLVLFRKLIDDLLAIGHHLQVPKETFCVQVFF